MKPGQTEVHMYTPSCHMYMYMKIHVHSTLSNLVVKEKKGNPDPTHHLRIVQTYKHKMTTWLPSLVHV